MDARMSQVTGVEDQTTKVSTVEQRMQMIRDSTDEKALALALSEKKVLEAKAKKTKDVEDPAAKVSVEEQIILEKDLAHGLEDGNLKPVDDDDEGQGEALRLLFEDEEDMKTKERAKLYFYLSTAVEERTRGVGDPMGANCWWD